uniref:Uncharacterized protein n=1 Tax=Aplanochytrium stocchinoi TaxID=215587 RepID=A0A7S3LLI5_9STRA|mmetsp:Transcript_11474/g.14278  ORF Transcript_11474/g.14278 Transcript_11474/m.14278 type:complete len:533 (-) Transcript_11474:189-1787(-)|eukprot:CAMPEP_0204839878 /NCGR_PEP_ID=MMETSP1346-20131115/35785_1 /ASSEMBLY_ACC=CAM_ASM_000771 /TAXON_ID=215587 /ORGANISM="Aplanochytrium stocchinoi, Strain GSBS06" /LENGTH=532 /DNA_ID=CAMNT_0051976941 /DNA_START=270 /DNA_END=1868 /DNA_ORIENTATION=-
MPYTPADILVTLHESPRYGDVREIPIPEDLANFDPATLQNDEQFQNYLIGVATPSALMIVFYVVWLILLCTAKCCNKLPCCGNICISVFFFLSVGVSACSWFISISGSDTLRNGLLDVYGGVQDALAQAESTEAFFGDISSIAGDVSTTAAAANASCFFIEAVTGFGLSDILGDIDTLGNESAADAGLGSSGISDITSEVNGFEDEIESVEGYWDLAYTVLTAVMMVMLLAFAFSTTIRLFEYNKTTGGKCPRGLVNCNRRIHKVECILIFTVGFLIVSLTYWVALVFGPLVYIGADVCVPDFTAKVLDIAAGFLEYNSTESFCNDFSGGDSFSVGPTVCYFATCEGENPLFADFGFNASDTAQFSEFFDEATAILSNATNQLADVNFTEYDTLCQLGPGPCLTEPQFDVAIAQCLNDTDAIVDDFGSIDDNFVEALDLLDCTSITPLYAKIAEAGLCNGVIAGAGLVFVTWVGGTMGFMIAMYTYLLLNLDRSDAELIEMGIIPKGAHEIETAQPYDDTPGMKTRDDDVKF